jgi:hypothetical protein
MTDTRSTPGCSSSRVSELLDRLSSLTQYGCVGPEGDYDAGMEAGAGDYVDGIEVSSIAAELRTLLTPPSETGLYDEWVKMQRILGWQLVPVEPTPAMIEALNGYAVCAGYIEKGYRAMLSAAPEAPK